MSHLTAPQGNTHMRTIFALALALALAGPAAAQELPPPPPPSDDLPLPPPPPPPAGPASASPATATPVPPPAGAAAAPAAKPKAKRHQDPPGVIGEGPIAPAGAQGALLLPDEEVSHWSLALASGLSGRWGGYPVGGENVANSSVLLYFGGQADGLWTEGYGTAARFRARLYTGGEGTLFLPSDGDLEAAWMVGRREFRFVIGRLEVGRYSGLAVQTLAQLSSLPSVEGNISFGGDKARLYYNLTPVELAYVWYYGGAHIVNSAAQQNENAAPEAATALRARLTFMVPPSVLLSLQGDYMQMWDSHDRLKAAELDAGYAVLDKTVLIDLSLRWESYTRRDNANPGAQATSDQFLGMASATLVF
jgi:hypothetical protein